MMVKRPADGLGKTEVECAGTRSAWSKKKRRKDGGKRMMEVEREKRWREDDTAARVREE